MARRCDMNSTDNYICLFVIVLISFSITSIYAQCEFDIEVNLNGAARIAIADVTGDSLADVLAIGIRDHRLRLYTAPTWQASNIAQNLDTAGYMIVTDLDADADNDIVLSVFGDDAIYWFENPAWTRHTIVDTLDGASGIAVVDIDGDDTLDVVAAGGYADIIVWYEAPEWTPHLIDGFATGSSQGGPEALVVSDFDLDGELEVVVSISTSNTSYASGVIVRYEAPAWTKQTIDENTGWCPDITAGDVDNDDTLDVAAAAFGTDQVVWYDVPSWQRKTIESDFNNPYGIAIADMNRDGINDVVVSGQSTNEPLRCYYGPAWAQMTAIDPIFSGRNYGDVAVGYLDGDSLLDVGAAVLSANDITLFVCVTAIEDEFGADVPYVFELQQNFPNPFNPATKITFSLPTPGHVVLDIFNTLGQKVITLLDKNMNAGTYDVSFDAATLPSGIYFYRIMAGENADVRKMVLLK